MDPNQLWQSALSEIELQVSKPNFVTWLKNSRLIERQDGVALVSLPNNFAKEWVENKYNKIILAAIRNLDETTKKIEFIVESQQNSLTKLRNRAQAKKVFSDQQSFSEWRVDPQT